MSLITEAQSKLGELFITGIDGLELSDDSAAFLSQAKIGGVILFSQNYENPAQVAELTQQIQNCRSSLPLWIAVDHEGGRVQRFKKPFTKIPDAQTIGEKDSPKLGFSIAEVIAKELKAVGINLNFAPVADIATNSKNPVIGPRSFGASEDIVVKMVTALVRGHLVHGVQPCVKHFPGHGDTSVDSHFALPKVDHTLEELRNREFKPFTKAFRSGCSMVMTAHILNPKLDPKYPATLSPRVIQEILRQELRYQGLIISDDMEMKAITDHFGPELAPRLALQAGCDLLIYRTEAASRHAYESLMKDLDSGELSAETVLTAAKRSQELKEEVLLPYEPTAIQDLQYKIGTAEHLKIIEQVTSGS